MIPRAAQALSDLATKILVSIAPQSKTPYAAADTSMIGMLLAALAREHESGTDDRLTDIADLQAIFSNAIAPRAGAAYPGRDALAEFVARTPADFKLTTIDALNADGLNLLIELHAWAETNDDALNVAIWSFLEAFADRHMLDPR